MKKATFLVSILILFFGLYAASSEADLNKSDHLSPLLKDQQKPRIKPLPRFALIQLSGYINVAAPDGRRMPDGIKIKVYEIKLGHQFYVKEVTTNKVGFYSVRLGNAFFRKTVRLVPQYPNIREGEHFSPRRQTFEIIKAKYVHDFSYSGPLPDLVCSNASGLPSRGALFCIGISERASSAVITVRISNMGEAYAGPFKVKLAGSFGDRREIVVNFRGIESPPFNEGQQTISLPGVKLEDVVISNVWIDIYNSVVESNERNNAISGPFL